MFKNQSIKSFFSNAGTNAKSTADKEQQQEKKKEVVVEKAEKAEKSPAKAAPSTPTTQKRLRKASSSSEGSVRSASPSPARKPSASKDRKAGKPKKKLDSDSEEKENSEASSAKKKKAATSAKKAEKAKAKAKLAVADPDSESSPESDASPAKDSVANSAKKRRLVLESSSEEEDISEKTTKSKAKPAKKAEAKEEKKPAAKAEVKEEKKPAAKAKSPKPEKTTKKAATPKKASPKPAKKSEEPVKMEEEEEAEIVEVAEVKVVKEEAAAAAETKVQVKHEMKLQDKVFDEKAGLVSKSTSNFFGGKKAEKMEVSAAGSGQTGAKGTFMPNKEKFHPVDDACWSKGDPVPFKILAQTLYCMEQTTKRLELLSITCNYFRSVVALTPKDLVPSLYLLTNKVAPDYENIELGIGDTVLFKALAEATGSTLAKLKSDFQVKGDIGLVAESNRCNQKLIFTPKKLSINNVFTKLKEIAQISGNSSQQKKCDLIKGLLVSCDAVEARYLMRLLAGKMRTGLGELSILSALGHACATTPPQLSPDDEVVNDAFAKLRKKEQLDDIKKSLDEAASTVKQAYFQCPNFDLIVSAIIAHGLDDLQAHCKVTPGVPLKPMLAHPTKGIQEVLKRFDQMVFTCEYKYDGERAQIHIMDDGSIKVYSRNSENNTGKYPDIIEMLQEILHLKPPAAKPKEDEEEAEGEKKERRVISAIIDSEVVAYDSEKHLILPFQVLSTRKRKDAANSDIKIKVCLFAFDLLYLNGKSYIEEPFRKRREDLYEYFPYTESKLMFAQNMNSSDIEAIQEFLEKSVKDGCEGLMVKTLDEEAHYEISKRSRNWLKLKKDYLDGVGDTLDLVVIGGYMGTGKRTGVYGGYLLACYDSENEEYQTICKIGTGFKDEDLQNQFESLSKLKIDKPKSYYRVTDGLEQPDHWFEPEQVWEVKCADFSLSPVHTASIGLISDDRGISMRFPRYLRTREDKKAEEATNSEQVAEMYKSQQQMVNQTEQIGGKKDSGDEEEEE